MMPLRIFGASGYGDTAKAIEAITYAADNGARMINASWGDEGFSQALYDAISYANGNGCLFVAAAGNSSSDNDTNPFYPASYDLPTLSPWLPLTIMTIWHGFQIFELHQLM